MEIDPTLGTALVMGGLLFGVAYFTMHPLRSRDDHPIKDYKHMPIGLRPVPATPTVGLAALRSHHPHGATLRWDESMRVQLYPPLVKRSPNTNV